MLAYANAKGRGNIRSVTIYRMETTDSSTTSENLLSTRKLLSALKEVLLYGTKLSRKYYYKDQGKNARNIKRMKSLHTWVGWTIRIDL